MATTDPTDTSTQQSELGAGDELRWRIGLMTLVGVLSMVAGAIVLAKPGNSLVTLAVITGVFVILNGIYELVSALFAARGGMEALFGILGIIIGILLVRHPVHGVVAIAMLLGLWLVATGSLRLYTTLVVRASKWNLLLALVEIVAGIVIVSVPKIGFSTLAVLVGISFLVNGIVTVVLGVALFRLEGAARELAPPSGPEPDL